MAVTYIDNFYPNLDFATLRDSFVWEKRDSTPRKECWMNDFGSDYTYGSGRGIRTYSAVPYNEPVLAVRKKLFDELGIHFEGAFQNFYENGTDHLGWHSDDDPKIDHSKPIAVVTFNENLAREIWYKEIGIKGPEHSACMLESGSLFLMPSGFQFTHYHRIPKSPRSCGGRISMTFRGLK